MRLKLAKISISNINLALTSINKHQAHLYFNKLSGITYISINHRKGSHSIDLDIFYECFSSLFAEL